MADFPVKNETLYFTDIKASVNKFKFLTIIFGCISIFVVFGTMVFVFIIGMSSKKNFYLIDREGYTYTAEEIDANRATEMQKKAFLLNFIKLAYAYDPNNIESNIRRALALADGSFGIYVKKHSTPNEIYALVKLGSISKVDDMEIIKTLSFSGEDFTAVFAQYILGSTGNYQYIVQISGKIKFVTPSGVDNPNGFIITNFIENYKKLTQ